MFWLVLYEKICFETSCKFCIPYEYWGISFIYFLHLTFFENRSYCICVIFICFTMINNIKNKVKNDKKYILNGKIQKKIYFEFLRSQDKSWNFKKVSVIFYPIFILHLPCFYNIHILQVGIYAFAKMIPWYREGNL